MEDNVIITAWHQSQVRQKPDKVVVKLYSDDGKFVDAINIPTVMWPLNAPYEVFHCNNTVLIENQDVFDAIDSVEYHTGFCYSNAGAVTEKLREIGYDAKTYVGWLFCNGHDYPIHHTWTVLDGNVIDLSDSGCVRWANREYFEKAVTQEERDALQISFHKWLDANPNHMRTTPGRPFPSLLYIGCECSPDRGRMIYNQLTDTYPDHPCVCRVGEDHMTNIQRKMKAAGCK